jgi:hypothetical protein
MNIHNISQAYSNLDKYTLNDVALKEVRKLTTDGINIKISNESLYDKIVNTFDKKRVILEKKSDILHHYYKDTTYAKDLSLDQQYDTRFLTAAKYLSITGLVGYNIFTQAVCKTPFLKLPGTLVSIGLIHFLERKISNSLLESRIERPWKIHAYRLSKGLGPTNVKDYLYKDNYGSVFKQDREDTKIVNYLHNEKFNYFNLSIYNKENPYAKNNLSHANMYKSLEFDKKAYVDPNLAKFTVPEQPSLEQEEKHFKTAPGITMESLGENAFDKENEENYKKFYEYSFFNSHYHKPQTFLSYETFEPNSAVENGSGDIINYKNEYDNVLSFISGRSSIPSYANTYLEKDNAVPEHFDRFILDWKLNIQLSNLKRKIHFLRKHGASDESIRVLLNNFNNQAREEKERFLENSFPTVKPAATEQYLIHSEEEESHLKKYFNFVKRLNIKYPKQKEEEDDQFDFEVSQDNYDPWEEYKKTYKDLLAKGRKYFIVQSIPEWKFLQVRKPKVLFDEKKSEYDDALPNLNDSIFHLLALERYHLDRKRKMNLYNQENHTHKI